MLPNEPHQAYRADAAKRRSTMARPALCRHKCGCGARTLLGLIDINSESKLLEANAGWQIIAIFEQPRPSLGPSPMTLGAARQDRRLRLCRQRIGRHAIQAVARQRRERRTKCQAA